MNRPRMNTCWFLTSRSQDQVGQGAFDGTYRSRRCFAANADRLQLHAHSCDLDNFPRTLGTPGPIASGPLTMLKEKLIKIGAKSMGRARHVAFQMAEVAIPQKQFANILRLITELRRRPPRPRKAFVRREIEPNSRESPFDK